MSMTDKELLHLRAYCASVLQRYGFNLSTDNPVTPALYIIHKEMEENNKLNKEIASRITSAAENIKPTVYNFNVKGEAWKFQMAKVTKWLIIGSILVVLSLGYVWYRSIQSDIKAAVLILDQEPALRKLLHQSRVDQQGRYFIDLTKSSDKTVEPFTEFIQVDSRTVRVYLDYSN